jgi:hypothetical protein
MKPSATLCAFVCVLSLSAPGQAAAPPSAPAPDEARLRALFERLDDDEFEVRQAADRELRALGKAATPHLLAERITNRSMEVCYRIDKMTQSLTQPERLAGWVRLLAHPDARCRERADQVLREACPQALPALLKIKHSLDEQCKAKLDKLIDELAESSY